MKNILKILSTAIIATGIFTACSKIDNLKKVDPLPVYQLGVSPVLSASTTTVAPVLADSSRSVITFNWTNPKYAQDSALYKYILEIDTTGKNFANERTKIVTGVLNTSLTGRDLNAYLLQLGFKLGVAQAVDVRLISSYGNNNERYMSNVLKITVTPFADPSVLVTEKTSVTLTLANAALPANNFSWTSAFKGYPANTTPDSVNYILQYDSSGKNFANPKDIAIGASQYLKGLTQGELNATALACGVPGGNACKIEYRIKAVSTLGAIAYSNTVSIAIQSYLPIRRMYLPGGYQAATGNGNDWDPGTAPELIRDLRAPVFNNMYYIYIYLPAGAQFKATVGRSWDVNYGGTGGVLSQNGANFTVTNAGYYRVSVDINTMKYDIRAGRMGFVGDATAAGWNPPNVFPTTAMGAAGTNLFVGISNFVAGGWKMIDNDSWNNGSNAVDETRSYGSTGGDGSTMEVNGANFPNITSAVSNRVIWDGRDVNNIKYFISPATEMRLVGDGINQAGVNDWDPPTSPQMTYSGNGVWTITIALKANKDIKFLAGNAWGAFDYEDNSNQSQATGVDKPIKWEGGNNFKTPTTAGTYTITLNEYTQTMKIN